uniref:Uncharacterized protein n=1 Tax=Panagrolaimus sp. PS1159 TaxID=55785 RepID=A0AC35G0A8_9BILA
MLKFYYSVIFLVFVLNVSKSSALTYNIDIKRYSAFPIISKTLGAAKDFYLSAALYVDENGNIGAILEAENAGDTNTAFYHSMITFKNGFPVATQPGEKAVFNISSFMSNPTITKFNELYYVLSQVSILTPKLDWEIDDSISAVYLTGLLHDKINCLEENDWTQCFFGLYSGAGNHIGAIKIIVSWQ